MEHPSGKKLFTAEKQRMQTQGSTFVATGTGSDAILAAIAALQNDVRSLDEHVRGQEGTSAPPATPARSLDEIEGDRERAEEDVKLLRNEIRAMSLAIHQTKIEIAALRPTNSEDDRLMVVTQELDAIVTATEGATNAILEAAERSTARRNRSRAWAAIPPPINWPATSATLSSPCSRPVTSKTLPASASAKW